MTFSASPISATNDTVNYFLTATSQSNGVLVSTGALALAGGGPVDIISPATIPFAIPGVAVSLYVDNNSPLTLIFPGANSIIGPGVTGKTVQIDPNIPEIWVQGQLTGIFGASNYQITIKVSKKPGLSEGGAALATAVLAILADTDSNIYSAFSRSQGAGGGAPNPLYTIGGYSPDAPDEPWYHPARDANVKLWVNQGLAGTSGHITLYTPPAGQAIRLLWVEASVNVFSNADFWLEEGNPAVRRLTPSNANFNANGTGMIVYRAYPHNGPTLATNAALALGYAVPANTVLDLTAGLYVG